MTIFFKTFSLEISSSSLLFTLLAWHVDHEGKAMALNLLSQVQKFRNVVSPSVF